MIQLVLESLKSERQHLLNRKSETPGNVGCPKRVEKSNFSPKRPSTLKISDMKP